MKKKTKRPCELRRERGSPPPLWPPGFLDNADWTHCPFRHEIVEVKPMELPKGLLFYLDYKNDEDSDSETD